MLSKLSIGLLLTLVFCANAESKQSSNSKVKKAILQNAADIAENANNIDENKNSITQIQVQTGAKNVYVHVDAHGSIGQIVVGNYGDAVIQADDYIFLADGNHINVNSVWYLDDECTLAVARSEMAVYRFLGKPTIAGLEYYTGQLYSMSENSQRHEVTEIYGMYEFERETGQPYESARCEDKREIFEGESVFYSVDAIDTPAYFNERVSNSNSIEQIDYNFDGEVTLRFNN